MPKKILYPRTNFRRSLELALKLISEEAPLTYEELAEICQTPKSGVFITTIGSAAKHGLVYSKGNVVSKTNLLDTITKNIGDNHMFLLHLSFLTPEVYFDIYKKYNGERLPVQELPKLLTQKYQVEERFAGRIAKYFLEGLEYLRLIDSNNILKHIDLEQIIKEKAIIFKSPASHSPTPEKKKSNKQSSIAEPKAHSLDEKKTPPITPTTSDRSKEGLYKVNIDIEEDHLQLHFHMHSKKDIDSDAIEFAENVLNFIKNRKPSS